MAKYFDETLATWMNETKKEECPRVFVRSINYPTIGWKVRHIGPFYNQRDQLIFAAVMKFFEN